ncbi:hypothetical protein F5879DRAFT_681448 [Lentinula edodes]|nr:hypothetical protein F5879DRAFT_681448 [Lentinula edodes]
MKNQISMWTKSRLLRYRQVSSWVLYLFLNVQFSCTGASFHYTFTGHVEPSLTIFYTMEPRSVLISSRKLRVHVDRTRPYLIEDVYRLEHGPR